MKLKLDANGNVVLQDGKPVYVHDDGKEVAFDAPATVQTISRINGEARSHRERAESAEARLKPFEGIEDPAAAIKALATVKNLDDKKLVDAGEVEKVKQEAIKAVRAEYEPVVKERDGLQSALYGEKIGGAFARSPFLNGDTSKVVIPPDMMQSMFGSRFKVEDGRTVAYDGQGQKIFSRARPGELADFDEALETMVDQYPHKAQILKGSGATGGGAQGGAQGAGGKATITRAQLEAIPPAGRGAALKGATLVD